MIVDPMSPPALRHPGTYPGVLAYWRETWAMRHFAIALGRGTVRATHQGNVLGILWQFLEPLLEIATYWIIFGLILDVSRGVENFIAFLTVGRIVYGFMQRSLISSAGSLNTQVPMLRSLAFPRILVPLASIVRSVILLQAELVVLAVAITLMGVRPRWSWLLLPLIMVAAAILSAGLGAGLARFVFRLPDLERLLTHLLRLNLYAAGVIFPLDAFLDSETLQRIATLNPYFAIVDLSRWSMLGTQPAHPGLALLTTGVATAVAVAVGFSIFVRGEHEFASTRIRRG